MSQREAIMAEVRALERLDLEGLRSEWRRRYGRPPKLRSVELLGLTLAWKIQSHALGGLDANTRRRVQTGALPKAVHTSIAPGTVFAREWRGVIHQVVAVEHGFTFKGETYANLSAVAFAITGVKWSGPLFFGLKQARRG